jgi:hypothetical protein
VFNLERQFRAQRARTLGMLLVPLDADYTIRCSARPISARPATKRSAHRESVARFLARAAGPGRCARVARERGSKCLPSGAASIRTTASSRRFEASTWTSSRRRRFPAALESSSLAFDIGTGTGVLAAVLARARRPARHRDGPGRTRVACARENVERLGLGRHVEVTKADLFPEGRAALVVCNPPWLPARPSSPLEHGIYDFESRMLRGFLRGLAAHLEPGGEGWLLLSDLAEHLGLRSREALLAWIEESSLKVLERIDVRPTHPRVSDTTDPLYQARNAEVTSLWRLA